MVKSERSMINRFNDIVYRLGIDSWCAGQAYKFLTKKWYGDLRTLHRYAMRGDFDECE